MLIAKLGRRFTGFDDQVIAPYARAEVRQRVGFCWKPMAPRSSPVHQHGVTGGVQAEVTPRQTRPLEPTRWCSLDTLRVKVARTASYATTRCIWRSGERRGGTRQILGDLD